MTENIEAALSRTITIISGFKLRSQGEKAARENLVNELNSLTAVPSAEAVAAEPITTPEMLDNRVNAALDVSWRGTKAATIDLCVQALRDYWLRLDGVPRYYVQEAEKRILALKDKP